MITLDPPEAIRNFAEYLDSSLHRTINDARLIHNISFAAFLEAILNLKGKYEHYRTVLESVKSKIGIQSARTVIQRLGVLAVDVIDAVSRRIQRATTDQEASLHHVCREAEKRYKNRVNHVLVVDAFSPVEFASLLVTAKRNGLEANLSDQVFVNPVGMTAFVQNQVEKSRLQDYAANLARQVGATEYSVCPLPDRAIHHQIGDVVSFVDEENNPFVSAWRKIHEIFKQPRLSPSWTVLITTDHGYDIYEQENILFVGHGRKGLAELSKVSFFALVTKKWWTT
jgi:hypothetical protein